jgi:ABC-2 type transport system permease protein
MKNRELNIIVLESRYEIVKLFRTTAFVIPTLTFPVVFYLLFGVLMGSRMKGGEVAVYLIATYGAFGVIGAALSSFGASIALERGQGLLQLKHATPMPLRAYIIAKLAAATLFSSIIVLSLFAAGAMFSGVRFDAVQFAGLFASLVAGTVPFALLGLTLGYIVSAQAAIAILNLIYLPMSFLSGLWVPIDFLPTAVQKIALWLPPFHLGQLALGAIGQRTRGTATDHLIALAGFALLFGVTSILAYRLDRRKNYA